MKLNRFYYLLFALLFCFSCSKNNIKESVIVEENLELQVLEAYKEGKKSLERGDVLFAAKKFNEAEILFPQSQWAPKSALMAAFSYYSQDYYSDAIAELERFIEIYANHKHLDYAYYLLAICYYEQIVDEKKDLQSIIDAGKTFRVLITDYPNTEYALDAEFKLDLINDILASKEMYIGVYYQKNKKWVAAINRFKNIIENYETTVYVEEALHRLVETNYNIGLVDEAEKYANVLGYKYQSSEWYEKSYKIFNKNYQLSTDIKKDKEGVFKKFKKLFQ